MVVFPGWCLSFVFTTQNVLTYCKNALFVDLLLKKAKKPLHHSAWWHLRGAEMQKKKKKKASERGEAWIWVIFDLWSDYSLSFLLKICRASRARCAPPCSAQHLRFVHAESEDSFSQATQPFTCTNMHLGGDKMENSSFTWLNRPFPPAAWQPFSTGYLLVGNNIDIHQCSHEGIKRSYTKDRVSTGVRRQGFSLQWLLLPIWGQALHLKCQDLKF